MGSKGKKGGIPPWQSEPRWDNSRNVNQFGRRLYPVSASLLKHRAKIYTGTPVDDGRGNYTFNRLKTAETWVNLGFLRVDQTFEYRGKTTIATHMIKMRYETPIEKADHIEVGGREYEVIHIDNDDQRRLFKTAMCTVWEV